MTAAPPQMNLLYYGDNLDILRRYIPPDSIDLIYLDPPFNSKADYNILFKEASGEQSTAQIQAFSDFWHWDKEAQHAFEYLALKPAPNANLADLAKALENFLGRNDVSAYLFMMAVRLLELHRVLKPTGSLFLHCDPNASHYLKLLMDSIFEKENFRNEIVWKRTSAHNDARRCGKIHDTLFFYSKTSEYIWHPESMQVSEEYMEEFLDQFDESVKKWYKREDLTAAGITKEGDSGKPWRNIDPSKTGRHWAIPEFVRKLVPKMGTSQETLDELDKIGRIHWPHKADGMPRLKRYEDEFTMTLQDIWDDIRPIHNRSRERLGYPTQKPVALLERIIKSCSDEGDWILDPFCGCGTAIVAAEKLNRRWIGIDITYLAIALVKGRLQDMFPHSKFKVEGEPRDLGAARELAKVENGYQFQWWATTLIGARPVGSTEANPRKGKKGADEGIDGWLRFGDINRGQIEKIVVQVKSGHVSVRDIRELRDTISRQGAAIGIFITLEEPTNDMVKEVKATDPYVSAMKIEYPKIQILTIQDLLQGKKPNIPPTISPFQEAPIEKRVTKHKNAKLG